MLASILGAAENLSVFDPASPPAESIRSLFILVLAITGGIFVAVEGMLCYCIYRFRRRPGDDGTEPPQIYGSKPIEVAWTVAPLLVVFVLFLVVVRTVGDVYKPEPFPGALRITVVGHQWWWEYRYPAQGVTTANELHVPVGRDVFLDLESVDVIHSFWVPRLGGKMDVIPGKTNVLWFRANEAGTYLGQCAEYCGTQHANMMIRVVADPADEFPKWLANQQAPARADPAVRAGRDLFLAQACVNCHTVRGTPAHGTFGPDLTHLKSRETLVTGMVPTDADQLSKWVHDPQLTKPGCLMPSMHFDDREVSLVVAYLMSLR